MPKEPVLVARELKITDSRDWTGYWIRRSVAAAGYETTSTFFFSDLRKDNTLLSAIIEGMTKWFEWTWDEEVKNEFFRSINRRSELKQLGIDWVLAAIDGHSKFADDDSMNFDTGANVKGMENIEDPGDINR